MRSHGAVLLARDESGVGDFEFFIVAREATRERNAEAGADGARAAEVRRARVRR